MYIKSIIVDNNGNYFIIMFCRFVFDWGNLGTLFFFLSSIIVQKHFIAEGIVNLGFNILLPTDF